MGCSFAVKFPITGNLTVLLNIVVLMVFLQDLMGLQVLLFVTVTCQMFLFVNLFFSTVALNVDIKIFAWQHDLAILPLSRHIYWKHPFFFLAWQHDLAIFPLSRHIYWKHPFFSSFNLFVWRN